MISTYADFKVLHQSYPTWSILPVFDLTAIHRRIFYTLFALLLLFSSTQAAEPKQKTILIRSGWQTVNIGDIGHTPGTLRYLETYLPDVKVVLWLHKTTDDVTTMLQKRFPNVQIVQGRRNE